MQLMSEHLRCGDFHQGGNTPELHGHRFVFLRCFWRTPFPNERHLSGNETFPCNECVRLSHTNNEPNLVLSLLSHPSLLTPAPLALLPPPLSPCISLLLHLFFISGEQAAAAGGEGAFSVLP